MLIEVDTDDVADAINLDELRNALSRSDAAALDYLLECVEGCRTVDDTERSNGPKRR